MPALVLAAGGLLSANVGLAFWLGIAFLILMLLLSKYAWGPITSALTERESTIEESITRAERALAEAKQLQADNDAARRDAERQAQTMLRSAREDADALRTAELDKTKAAVLQMQEGARADIAREKEQALAELRSEVASLAVGAAEKILKSNLDADAQRGLVDEFIADLPKN